MVPLTALGAAALLVQQPVALLDKSPADSLRLRAARPGLVTRSTARPADAAASESDAPNSERSGEADARSRTKMSSAWRCAEATVDISDICPPTTRTRSLESGLPGSIASIARPTGAQISETGSGLKILAGILGSTTTTLDDTAIMLNGTDHSTYLVLSFPGA